MTGLSPQDELALRIGRVAREHATLDNYLRTAHTTLMSPGLGTYLTPAIRRTGTLVEGCLKMLGKADVPIDVLTAGRQALDRATTVNRERNEVVHGVWVRAFKDDRSGAYTDELRWTNAVGSARSTPHDLASLDDVVFSLGRASIRIIALIEALWCTLPFFRDSFSHPLHSRQEEIERWVKVMEDRFRLRADGGFQIEAERPNA